MAQQQMDNISELEQLISIRIIHEDAEAISSLISSERDSIFTMEIIPYYALFVQSCQEYIDKNFLPEKIALDIKDIRNHIKLSANCKILLKHDNGTAIIYNMYLIRLCIFLKIAHSLRMKTR